MCHQDMHSDQLTNNGTKLGSNFFNIFPGVFYLSSTGGSGTCMYREIAKYLYIHE